MTTLTKVLSIAVVAALSSCANAQTSGSRNPAAPAPTEADEANETTATYEVPVPDNLKDVAKFELTGVYHTVSANNGAAEIRYDLPLELTGVVNSIVLKSTSPTHMSGPNADAECVNSVCQIRFKNLVFDRDAVSDLFKQQGLPKLEAQRRLAVFDSFSGDPAGIIHLR